MHHNRKCLHDSHVGSSMSSIVAETSWSTTGNACVVHTLGPSVSSTVAEISFVELRKTSQNLIFIKKTTQASSGELHKNTKLTRFDGGSFLTPRVRRRPRPHFTASRSISCRQRFEGDFEKSPRQTWGQHRKNREGQHARWRLFGPEILQQMRHRHVLLSDLWAIAIAKYRLADRQQREMRSAGPRCVAPPPYHCSNGWTRWSQLVLQLRRLRANRG